MPDCRPHLFVAVQMGTNRVCKFTVSSPLTGKPCMEKYVKTASGQSEMPKEIAFIKSLWLVRNKKCIKFKGSD